VIVKLTLLTATGQHHRRVRRHLFPNDMQGTRHSKPSKGHEVTAGLGAYVTAVNDWCASKRLPLNTNKTEVMWLGEEPQQTLFC